MKLITLKLKIVIGVVLFVILICAGYSATTFHFAPADNKTLSIQIGKIEYKGQFLMPVENFKVVTSKYGARIHPITRKK